MCVSQLLNRTVTCCSAGGSVPHFIMYFQVRTLGCVRQSLYVILLELSKFYQSCAEMLKIVCPFIVTVRKGKGVLKPFDGQIEFESIYD